MVAAGAGIAPFVGLFKDKLDPVAALVFGCRKKDEDFLYREDIQKVFAEDGNYLATAFSRESDKKYYVQDALQKDDKVREMIIDIAKNQHGRILVCGSSAMCRGVTDALSGILADEGGRDCVDEMQKDKLIVVEHFG